MHATQLAGRCRRHAIKARQVGRKVDMSTNRITRRQFSKRIAASAAAGELACRAFARAQQDYPSRPVRFILPFGAAGVADITARLAAEKLGDKLGQRFVVENQPGPGGIAAARAVLSQPADGYTIGLVTNGTAISVAHLQGAAVRSGEGIRADLDDRQFRPGVRDQRRIPSSRRCRTSSRRRASSRASSMSAPSPSAARRTSGRSCSRRRPA